MGTVTQENKDENLKKFYDLLLTAKNEIVLFLKDLEPVQIIGYGKEENDISLTIRVKDKGDFSLSLKKIDYSDLPKMIDNDDNNKNC